MLLIFGVQVVLKTVDGGTFFCPSCGGDRDYRRRRARRWVTLFFIPVIPLRPVGDLVECSTCRSRLSSRALLTPTAGKLTTDLQRGTRALAIAMLRAGDSADENAQLCAIQMVRDAGIAGYDEGELGVDLATLPEELTNQLAGLTSQMALAGRESLLAGAIRVALADGPLTDGERAAVREGGAALGMTPAHTYGVLAVVEQGTPPTL